MTSTSSEKVLASANKVHPSDSALTKRLFGEIKEDMRLFTLSLLLYLPVLGAQLAQPWLIAATVDKGYRQRNLDEVWFFAAFFFGAVVLRTIVEILQHLTMQHMGQRAVRRLRNRLFNKIQRLPMSYFDVTPLGKVMTRVTNDVEALSELFSSGAVRIIGDVLYLVGTLVAIFIVNVKLSLTVVATLPVLLIGVQLFRSRARAIFRQVRALLSALNGYLQEHLSGMHIVQLFDQGEPVRKEFEVDNRNYMVANRSAIALDAGVYAFVDAMSSIAVAAVLLVGAGMQDSGVLSLGILVGFVDALGNFFVPIRELSNKYTVIQSAFAAAERIFEMEDEPEQLESGENLPASFEQDLAFDDVRFAYGDGPEVLKGLSFTIAKGDRVALVGHTGTGKSTIIKLVGRMYDVTGGAIRIDGVDIRSLEPKGLRALSVSVPQDVFLFSGTLRDNLIFGRPQVSDDEVLRAVESCQADAVLRRHGGIERLRDALDTEVRERGQNFSLGERQLLALVRALLCNPPILILDEATASVDRDTERRLQEATERLMEDRTAIIVAHRLSTIRHCDRIFLFHHGRLDEAGTHDELMALDGRYAKFVALQESEGGA